MARERFFDVPGQDRSELEIPKSDVFIFQIRTDFPSVVSQKDNENQETAKERD